MNRRSTALLALLAALLLVVAGCGGSDEPDEESATPTEAVGEIEEIKSLLATAVQQVRDGDSDAAEETVGDAYLEHFEDVEAPLGERDHDFMEELEEAISTDLRNEIKDGGTADEIEASVEEINVDLDRAMELLEG